MNNLFTLRSPKKTLFTKAYITASAQTIITDFLQNLLPELSHQLAVDSYTVFIDPQKDLLTTSLCSQNNHILTFFKLHKNHIEDYLQTAFTKNGILSPNQSFKLKIYYK